MRDSKKPVVILLADDDQDDRDFTRDALEESRLLNKLHCVEDGEELLDYLNNRNKYADKESYVTPGLILLDLNMPKIDGRQALKEIKSNPKLRHIPVVILTTSKAEEDIFKSYDSGANSFITKPVKFDGLVEAMKALGKYWFELVELPTDMQYDA